MKYRLYNEVKYINDRVMRLTRTPLLNIGLDYEKFCDVVGKAFDIVPSDIFRETDEGSSRYIKTITNDQNAIVASVEITRDGIDVTSHVNETAFMDSKTGDISFTLHRNNKFICYNGISGVLSYYDEKAVNFLISKKETLNLSNFIKHGIEPDGEYPLYDKKKVDPLELFKLFTSGQTIKDFVHQYVDSNQNGSWDYQDSSNYPKTSFEGWQSRL